MLLRAVPCWGSSEDHLCVSGIAVLLGVLEQACARKLSRLCQILCGSCRSASISPSRDSGRLRPFPNRSERPRANWWRRFKRPPCRFDYFDSGRQSRCGDCGWVAVPPDGSARQFPLDAAASAGGWSTLAWSSLLRSSRAGAGGRTAGAGSGGRRRQAVCCRSEATGSSRPSPSTNRGGSPAFTCLRICCAAATPGYGLP